MKREVKKTEADVTEENKEEKVRIFLKKLFGAEVNEKNLDQARDNLEKEKNLYLQGATDSLKWTSAIVVGAILWIGNIITSIPGHARIIAIVGLISLIMSLFLAIMAANEVLTARAQYWRMANQVFDHSVMFFERERDPSFIDDKDIYKTILNSLDELKESIPYSKPDRFIRWINWHRNFLLIGLIFYLVSEIFLCYSSYFSALVHRWTELL